MCTSWIVPATGLQIFACCQAIRARYTLPPRDTLLHMTSVCSAIFSTICLRSSTGEDSNFASRFVSAFISGFASQSFRYPFSCPFSYPFSCPFNCPFSCLFNCLFSGQFHRFDAVTGKQSFIVHRYCVFPFWAFSSQYYRKILLLLVT